VDDVSGKQLSPEPRGRLGRGCGSVDVFSDELLLFPSLEGKVFARLSGCELLRNELDVLIEEYCVDSSCWH